MGLFDFSTAYAQRDRRCRVKGTQMSKHREHLPWQAYKINDAYDVVDTRGVVVADCVQSKDHANLIAAAPSMLEILKQINEFFRHNNPVFPSALDLDDSTFKDAVANIVAKAEGREP